MACTVDNRSRFVAGISFNYGSGYGMKSACSDGQGPPSMYQTQWNMADVNGTNFPKLPNGRYNPLYYYPPGGLITQVIVLQAQNPWGDNFGSVPAVIFTYITPVTEQVDFVVCGNADYAGFYLNPAAFPPPPTQVVLQQQYTSPLSPFDPGTYLGGFDAFCSQRGTGYLGGDPNTSSKYHLLHLEKVCFAPCARGGSATSGTPDQGSDQQQAWLCKDDTAVEARPPHMAPSPSEGAFVILMVKKLLEELSGVAADGTLKSCLHAVRVMQQHMEGVDFARRNGSSMCWSASSNANSNTSGGVASSPGQQQQMGGGDLTADEQQLPQDWLLLRQQHGMRSFYATTLKAKNGSAVAVISLASRAGDAFQKEWCGIVDERRSQAAAAADLFISPNDVLSSLLVVPFKGCLSQHSNTDVFEWDSNCGSWKCESCCVGGLYLSQTTPSDFVAAQAAAASIAQLLQHVVADVVQQSGMFSGNAFNYGIELLQRQVRDSAVRRASSITNQEQQQFELPQQLSQRAHYNEDLRLHKLIGKGGFAQVYAGSWQGSPAAVKVMYVPQQQRTLVKNAMEIAVMQNMSHPNIVRVYSCLTDMVEEAELPPGARRNSSDLDAAGQSSTNPAQLRYRALDDNESLNRNPFTCNIVVMELCDKMCRGSSGPLGLPGESPTRTASGRAPSAIQGRAAAENVLLRTSADSSLGFVCKLCDFGLVKLLADQKLYLRNQSASGTITYLPPERFVVSSSRRAVSHICMTI
eukprot:gene3126-3404_t